MLSRPLKKPAALLLALFLVLNVFAVIPAFAAESEPVAAWDYTSTPPSAAVPATSGTDANKANASLTNFKSATPSYSSSSLSINGWDNGAGAKYWQIGISSKGYENLALAAKTRSSGTGPRDFKVIFSIDNGTSWVDVPNSSYAITGTALSSFMPTVTLPAEAADKDNLQIRFIMTSNISSRAGTSSYPADEAVASGGTSNINNILISGTPIANPLAVDAVTASPGGGEILAGSKVTLSCATDGATIMYSVNDSEFIPYDPATQVSLDSLPATLKAYASKIGMVDSTTSSWSYTQAQVNAVFATPNGGAVTLGTQITLSCDTQNATIKYSVDNGQTYSDYSAPVTITSLPFTLQAYAVKSGMKDGTVSTFNFTQKVSSDYNLYFGQLHSHTNYSDGIGTPTDAYSHARDVAKLDFLAVTDHSNSLDNASAATMADGSVSPEWVNGHAAADQFTGSSFVGIYGFEMTWSNGTGHINTFNTPGFENRDTPKYKNADGLLQYSNVLKQFPLSISQFNHPGTTFGDFNDFANYDPQIDKLISLVEVGNGEGQVGSGGYFPSYEYYTRALDKGWHLAPTNNQDNHMGLWGDANTARTVVLADSLTRDNVYDAMRNMRVYATEDNNLRIKYTLDGEVMGSILPQKPDSVNIKVDLSDPDNEALGRVSVIVNGGKVAASQTLSTSTDTVNFTLNPDYAYYYIRVDEADGDIAVTAPVWIGEVDKAGIAKTSASTMLPVKGEPVTITSSLYNNESSPLNITSLEYSVNGSVINATSELGPIASLATASYSFSYVPASAGSINVDVKLTALLNGVEKVYTDVLKLDVSDPALVTKVIIDASHFNDYVYGYYSGNMKNITTLANAEKIQVTLQKDPLTDAALANAQLLILTPPAKKAGTVNGVSYGISPYTADEIAVIKGFADRGGNIIVVALADYQDSRTDSTNHSAYQQNLILEAIGATTRVNDDEVVDYDNNPNVPVPGVAGGTPYRVPMNVYNMDSQYLNGVAASQNYSFYSGCSITLGNTATWLVKGTPTTYGFDSDNDKLGGAYVSAANKTIPDPNAPGCIGKGNVVALATETLPGGGHLFVGGTVFFSDFEIKASLDNYTQLQNSNYNITMNILDSVKKVVPVSPISQIRAGQMGDVFSAEGIVTAGTTAGNAFFDTIYIQDATGGINLFPVSGMDIKVGQKVKVVGTLDEYQGDKELRVLSIAVTDTAVNPVVPADMSTKDAMDSSNGGMLVKVDGKVTKVDLTNGTVSAIYLADESGVQARLFIDGYIGYSDPAGPKLEDIAQVGGVISGIGLASADTEGNRLRVRDRSEIVLIHTPGQQADIEAAQAVTDKINAIPSVVTLADKQQVVDARAAYNSLSESQKALVTNLDKLTAAEAAIETLEVDAVIAKIAALPATVTLADKPAVLDARAAYNALSDAQKARVTNLDKLIAAESQIAKLDQTKADAVIWLINHLPHNINLQNKQIVQKARAAYDALSPDQKALVTNLDKLVAAENTIAKLEADNAAADAVSAKIDALPRVITLASKQTVQDARTAYDALTADQKKLVKNLPKLLLAEKTIERLEAYQAEITAVIAKIDALPAVITLADKNAVQQARNAYDRLDRNQKKQVTNLSKLIAAEKAIAKLEADKNAADSVMRIINSLPSKLTLSDKHEVEKARAAFNALTADQKTMVSNLDKLAAAENTIAGLEADKSAAEIVVVKINALPHNITLADKQAVQDARAAYESLTAQQKTFVTNLRTLLNAEDRIAHLSGGNGHH